MNYNYYSLSSHSPILSHCLCPPEVQPFSQVARIVFSRLLDQRLPLPFAQVGFQTPTHGNRPDAAYLIHQSEEPPMVPHHVRHLHTVFENFADNRPHLRNVDAVDLNDGALGILANDTHINHRLVVDSQTLLPECRPLRLPEVSRLKVLRGHHQQRMKVGVSTAISLRACDLCRPYPTKRRPGPELCQSLPRPSQLQQCGAERSYGTVLHRQREEDKTSIGIINHQSRQRLIQPRLPLKGTPPLADWTMPNPTKPRIRQLQFSAGIGGRRAGELQHLRALLHLRGIAPMMREPTVREDVLDFVSLCSVLVPGFMTGGKVPKVLIPGVDIRTVTWYCDGNRCWFTRASCDHRKSLSYCRIRTLQYRGFFFSCTVLYSLHAIFNSVIFLEKYAYRLICWLAYPCLLLAQKEKSPHQNCFLGLDERSNLRDNFDDK